MSQRDNNVTKEKKTAKARPPMGLHHNKKILQAQASFTWTLNKNMYLHVLLVQRIWMPHLGTIYLTGNIKSYRLFSIKFIKNFMTLLERFMDLGGI